MNDQDLIDTLAREIISARDGATQLEPFTSRIPGFDVATAYRVQARVHARGLEDGASAVGRKIGFTNRATWPRYNVDRPIWAHIYAHTVHQGAASPSSFTLSGLVEPRIEPEVVCHLASAPRPGDSPAQLLRRLDWIALGYEVVQSHFPRWQFAVADTVADGGLHGALLIGPHWHFPRDAAPERALREFRLELLCDGTVVDAGRGADVLGGAHHALHHLVTTLAADDDAPALTAGEIVTTGTLTDVLPIAAGQTWTARIDGIELQPFSVQFD